MEKNKEYIGEVLSLGSEGEGVINCGGVNVYVPFCLVGERVGFKVLKVDKKAAYGKLTRIYAPSNERVTPACPQFLRCGGCQLQHAAYSAQLKFKAENVKRCLYKIGGLDIGVNPTVASPLQYGYRNKLAVPVGVDENGETQIGFYAPRSHRIIPAAECALQKKWSGTLISSLRAFMEEAGLRGYDEVKRLGDIRRLVAREVEDKLIITVVAQRDISLAPFVKRLEGAFKKFTLWLNINGGSGNAIFGDKWRLVCDDGAFYGDCGGIKFKAGANTFLQVNDGVRSLLYSATLAEVAKEGAAAIDLYSGGGILTAMLAKACGCAYGVEIVPEAVACADELKSLNSLTGKMFNICGRVEEKLDYVFEKTAGMSRVIVCDPPRKGMERSVISAILASGADRIALISCDPATLARDAGLLCGSLQEVEGRIVKNPACTAAGLASYYKIESVTPYDMFPQTKHVETLAILSRGRIV